MTLRTEGMIRPANTADIPALLEIWNPIIRDTSITFTDQKKSPEDLARMLTAKAGMGQPFLVAETKEGLAGFATYGAFRSGPGYTHIAEETILLSDWAWGRGIGRQLIGTLADHARDAKIGSLIAGISGENLPAIAFHKAVGFVERGRIPRAGWKFGRWIDLVLMQMPL